MKTNTKTKVQHTPGPWKMNGTQLTLSDGTVWSFIPRYPSEKGEAENKQMFEVNGPLIATAPELLVELKRMHHTYGKTHIGYEKCSTCAAIAKAESK